MGNFFILKDALFWDFDTELKILLKKKINKHLIYWRQFPLQNFITSLIIHSLIFPPFLIG